MKTTLFSELMRGNRYPGRGIVIGKSEDGKKSALAYFITGRSENSRNRVFVYENGSLFTRPFDETKVKDPSLIIYRAMATLSKTTVITNGDQTDTVNDFLLAGKSFEEALATRCYEPDAPNFTPRISGILSYRQNDFEFELSILKRASAENEACERRFFRYAPTPGEGKFISTYRSDGDPLPAFEGEPKSVFVASDPAAFANDIWQGLDKDNRISLFVQYRDLITGKSEEILINKHGV